MTRGCVRAPGRHCGKRSGIRLNLGCSAHGISCFPSYFSDPPSQSPGLSFLLNAESLAASVNSLPRKSLYGSAPPLKLQSCGFHCPCDISTSCFGISDTDTGASTPTCSSLSSPSQQMVPPTHRHKPKPGCQTWLSPPLTIFHPGHQQVLAMLCPHFPKSHHCHPLSPGPPQ